MQISNATLIISEDSTEIIFSSFHGAIMKTVIVYRDDDSHNAAIKICKALGLEIEEREKT
jgi:hypothetical protein